jgi:glycosyltransferase involved in cell wall biosynthesis
MTTPLLSLIIPHHNHTATLPALLDSVQRQSFRDLEVIVVDDCSDEPVSDIIAAYARKGLDIRCLTHSQRIYTRAARMAGIREARGQIIAFADADDLLLGEDAMERNVHIFLQHMPDILHFRFSIIDSSGAFVCHADPKADPPKRLAEGEDVFALFAQSSFYHISPVWNKYYSRKLRNILIEIDHPDTIKRNGEDFYLNSLCFYHAKKYVGSEIIGYGYRYDHDTFIEKAKIRATEGYLVMKFMDKYLTNSQCKEIYKDQYHKSIVRLIALEAGRVCRDIHEKYGGNIQRHIMKNLLAYADERTWMEILLLGNGYNADKICRAYHELI